MNQTYKVIWNHAKQLWMAVGELTKSKGKSKISLQRARPLRSTGTVLLAAGLTLMATPAISGGFGVYWDTTDGNWADNGAWLPITPTGVDEVYIDTGYTVQVTSGTALSAGLHIGGSSASALEISGGSVTSSNGFIGDISGNTGTVTVDGSSSTWTSNSMLTVGGSGTGNLIIRNGGTVNSGAAYIGLQSSGTGTVIVDGSGSSWTSSSIRLGHSGAANLTIRNGGTVSVGSGTGTVDIAYYTGAVGYLNIGAAQGQTAAAPGTLNAATVAFNSFYAGLVFNHTSTAYDFAPAVTSGSNSNVIGLYGGTTRFTGDLSSYFATMSVDGGTLSIAAGDTLLLGGNYSQTANGTLKIGASSASSFGKLNVQGTATFAAGTNINVDVAAVNTLANGGTLSGVISAGTIDASTFNLTDNSTLFDFTAVVNGSLNTVDLKVSKVANIADSVIITGFTPGTGAAKVLDDLSSGSNTGDMATVVTAFGQLNGDAAISQAVADTLPLLVSGTTQIATGTLHSTNRVVQARQQSFSGLSSGDGFLTDKHLWVKPVGNWSEQEKRSGVSGYKADSYGLVGGIDGDLNDTTKLGFAVSYMNTDVRGKDSSSGNTADIDAYQAIVYGSHALAGNLELNWQADVGLNKNEGSRYISFMNRVAKADYDSYTAHIGAGIGKSFALNDKTTVIPGIRADYAYIKDESYAETGADALDLNVDSSTSDELILTAQSNLSHELNDKATLIANAGIGYDLINDQTSLTASYAGGGTAFTTKGIDPGPWIGSAGAGIHYNISDISEITARYDIEGRSDFLSQTASVKFRWMF